MAIGSISLLVGALMITNTTMMSVIERTREIGIIKSIGGRRSHVLTIFMTESVLIALIGGILGCILTIGVVISLTGIVESTYGFPLAYSFQPWIFIAGIGLAAGIGALAGAFPSWRAASVKPVEALRYQ
jgi:putative ABC transport system permease protein